SRRGTQRSLLICGFVRQHDRHSSNWPPTVESDDVSRASIFRDRWPPSVTEQASGCVSPSRRLLRPPLEHARQPQHDTRIEGDKDRESDQNEQVWQGDLGDIAEALLGQPLYHEQVESHGWCHLSHLDHKHEKDPKPDWVVAGALNNRHHD